MAGNSALEEHEGDAILEVAAFDEHGEFVQSFGDDRDAAKGWRRVNRTHSLRYRHVTPWTNWIGPLDSPIPLVPIHRPTVSATWSWHKAGKQWTCHMCEDVIGRGERYAKCSYTYFGQFRGSEPYHAACAPATEPVTP